MVRNFQPTIVQKNVSDLGSLIDKSNQYWANTNQNVERLPSDMKVANVMRKNRLICTKVEYDAYLKLARAYRAYRLRCFIQRKIDSKKAIGVHR